MSRRSSSRDRGGIVKEEASSPSSPSGSDQHMVAVAPAAHPPSPSGSPVMLTTMTPVSVIEFQKEYEEQQAAVAAQHHTPAPDSKIIYVHGGGDAGSSVLMRSGCGIVGDGGNHHDQHSHPSHHDDQQAEMQLLSASDATSSHGGYHVNDAELEAAGVAVSTGGGTHHTTTTAYPGPQGTTILVLSELVDDMSPLLGLRTEEPEQEEAEEEEEEENNKRKRWRRRRRVSGEGAHSMAEDHQQQQQHQQSQQQHQQQQHHLQQQQQDSPSGGAASSWRSYYEHPLTAATSAMLNIGAAPDDPTAPGSASASSPFVYEYYKLPPSDKEKISDIWQAGGGGGGGTILTSTLKGVAGGGLEIGGQQLADIPGLFLHHPGSGGGGGGLISTHPSAVKREPEDLSHHRKSSSGDKGRHKVVLVTSGGPGHPDHLVVDVVNNNNNPPSIKDEFIQSPQQANRSMNGTPSSTSSLMTADPNGPIEIIPGEGLKTSSALSYGSHIFTTMTSSGGAGGHGSSGSPSPIPYSDHATVYGSQATSSYITTSAANRATPVTAFTDPYYREYFTTAAAEQSPYVTAGLRQVSSFGSGAGDGSAGDAASNQASFVERYVRQSSAYHNKGVIAAAGLTVDLPSPDSGIGADAITPRDQTAIQQSFDYSEMCGGPLLGEASRGSTGSQGSGGPRTRPWHDFGRQNDADKIQIPKIYSQYGFKYHLETPISTNQRREDDRVTYINKGQFYGITMEYIPDPDRPLKAQTVKSVVMLMFREEKSPEDEIKAWQFWHGRQHSVKQRILDADTKNSVGFVGCIEEVAHNAIAVYWNPLESSAKLNIAVQCLSTDFSSQKGVKGLPLHVQIDTYEDPRDGPVIHRGYCQIKVFCDKGAERKTRDEERRAAKRKMAATGRKKIEELYHPACERSEFYSMTDLTKPPVLFTPAEDIDKLTSMELQGFYGHETDTSSLSNGEAGPLKHSSPFLLHSAKSGTVQTQTLKFHNHFPPDALNEKKEEALTTDGSVFSTPPIKRPKMIPPLNERVMLYVRQDSEEVYTPLHVVPPTTSGLLNAIENKYKISASSISNLYRKNRKGILAKIDEEMLTYYCNEDLFLLEVRHSEESEDLLDIILVELPEL